jgi:hypothetical protein
MCVVGSSKTPLLSSSSGTHGKWFARPVLMEVSVGVASVPVQQDRSDGGCADGAYWWINAGAMDEPNDPLRIERGYSPLSELEGLPGSSKPSVGDSRSKWTPARRAWIDSDANCRTQRSVCGDTAPLSSLAASDMLRELVGSSVAQAAHQPHRWRYSDCASAS